MRSIITKILYFLSEKNYSASNIITISSDAVDFTTHLRGGNNQKLDSKIKAISDKAHGSYHKNYLLNESIEYETDQKRNLFQTDFIYPEFQANTYSDSYQECSSASMMTDGGFALTWHSHGQNSDGVDIYARIYQRNGTANDAEFKVNTYSIGDQVYPAIATLSDGSFAIAWENREQSRNDYRYGMYSYEICTQVFYSNGTARGFESCDHGRDEYQNSKSITITPLPQGEFVTLWRSYYGIFGKKFWPDGTEKTPIYNLADSSINTRPGNHKVSSAALLDGEFVILWDGYDFYPSGSHFNGVHGQLFDSNLIKKGSEFYPKKYYYQTGGSTYSFQGEPSVAAFSNGEFVGAWSNSAQDGSKLGIYSQRYFANGTKKGDEFQVNTYTSGHQFLSSVTVLYDNSFVVSWVSENQDGSGLGIYAQIFFANGIKKGGELQVNTYTENNQWIPSVISLLDGFLVTWSSYNQDGSSYGIYAQRFDLDGRKSSMDMPAASSKSPLSTETKKTIGLSVGLTTGVLIGFFGTKKMLRTRKRAKEAKAWAEELARAEQERIRTEKIREAKEAKERAERQAKAEQEARAAEQERARAAEQEKARAERARAEQEGKRKTEENRAKAAKEAAKEGMRRNGILEEKARVDAMINVIMSIIQERSKPINKALIAFHPDKSETLKGAFERLGIELETLPDNIKEKVLSKELFIEISKQIISRLMDKRSNKNTENKGHSNREETRSPSPC